MAFCTNCGASVNGAFCVQCGTPVKAAAGQPAAPPPASPTPSPAFASSPVPPPVGPAAPQPIPGAVVPRKTSPVVWILVAVLGLFVVGGVVVVGTLRYFVHKAGLDPELMQRNPGLAVSKMIAAVNPDVDVLSTDDARGRITVRDKKTGKVVTLNFDDVKNGKFTFSATGDDGKTASMEFGATTAKLPSWIPTYPGAETKGTFSIKGDDGSGRGEGGSYAFTTPDSPAKVKSFYEDKCKQAGMKVNMNMATDQGGMIVATDEGERHSLTVTVTGGAGDTNVAVIYGTKQ